MRWPMPRTAPGRPSPSCPASPAASTSTGPLAFIGLSQVRETATFSGIPLVDRLEERTCGVWVVDMRNGQTLGFLRFEEGVQEIFAVQVLHNMRYPEMLEWGDKRLAHSYVLPDQALRDVPAEMRSA